VKKQAKLPIILFVTGTDTGVGKTLFTAMLLHHLREQGHHAHAVKPFCSGGTGDVTLLGAMQKGELAPSELNPFYYDEPVAPLIAGRAHKKCVSLPRVLAHLRKVSSGCEVLLVEGSGGLLVPLGEGYTVADLIRALQCEVVVVARNKLGTINHTLLTVRHLEHSMPAGNKARKTLKVVLMDSSKGDKSKASNAALLRELLHPVPVFEIPFLGRNACSVLGVKNNQKKIAKTLASILR